MFLGKRKQYFAVSLLIFIFILNSRLALATHEDACSTQWRITGYFTPIESDYPQTELHQINIEKHGQSFHSAEFLKEVRIEGWGRTKEGWYLGRFSNKWHKSEHPLNSIGKPLKTGSVATDKKVIPTGSKLKIPSLPNKFKHQLYVSDDVGSAIKNMHIDIYTGEGRDAEKTTYEITGKDHTVCRISSL